MPTVYILHSEKLNRFYTGYTEDIDQRMHFHSISNSGKYTEKAKDWVLIFKLDCEDKPQALAIENHIKKMKSKVYIENLVRYPKMSEALLKRYKTC